MGVSTVMLDEKFRVYAEAIADMALLDEDHGLVQNQRGFNRFDSPVGHTLARTPFEDWSPDNLMAARRILQRYKTTQLPALGYLWESFPEVETLPEVATRSPQGKGYATIAVEDGDFVLAWGGSDPYFRNRIDSARTLPGARYDKVAKAWRVPMTMASIDAVAGMLAVYAQTTLPFAEADGFRDGVEAFLGEIERKLMASQAEAVEPGAVTLRRAKDGDKVRPFQLAGIAFATENRKTIIADDMGLGKTVQSILSVAENDALPCLVICPASLKLNWQREINMWVDGEPVVYVAGGTKGGAIPANVDFMVINYDVMHAWRETLAAFPWKAVIADECHYLKTDKSQRSKAVKEVIAKTDPEMRLMLTGTPILNKPIELWPVLGLIDGQRIFGSWFKYTMRYCELSHNGFGYSTGGSSNLDELNTELRSSGLMIRRRKEDVLTELPDKQWATLPVPMAPASMAKAYDNAERDLQKFLQEMSGDDTAEVRAAALQRISTLRKIAWHGKMKAAYEWIDDFLETGKKLVVFGWHREAVEAIADRYDAPKIMGGMNKQVIEDGKDAFQNDPECRIIVCNIAAGGVGHTLTAASDVLFLEFAWNYALMDQAISRCHRIGQRDTVTGWMLAATMPDGRETIDHEMIEVIHRKEQIVSQAIDGNVEQAASNVRSRMHQLMQEAEADNAIAEE